MVFDSLFYAGLHKKFFLSVRDGSRAAATSKMEWFVILGNSL